MRHGTQLAPDGSVPNSHELARCAACESILYDVPVLLDGIPLGKVAWRCPHCHDGRPLECDAMARQQQRGRPTLTTQERLRSERSAAATRARRRSATSLARDAETRLRAIEAVRAYYLAKGRVTPTHQEMGAQGLTCIKGLPSRSVLVRLFGSLRGLLVAANIPVRDSGRQVSQDALELVGAA